MSEKVECCLIAIQTKSGIAYRIVNDTSFTIGRSEDCIFQINDSSVSRVHLAVTAKDGHIWIRDNNSTFGTTINGKKLAPAVQIQIKNGDRIVLGSADGVLGIQLVEMVGGNENADTVVGYNVNNNNLDIQINQTLQEAKKQAAQIIYESEFEAEKKAQNIFAEAKLKMQQSELAYNTKVEEAQKMSEKILTESQKQGHEMVQEARKHAQNMREETDKFAAASKQETLQQSQDILRRAHAEAELIKDKYINSVKESAVEKARKEVQAFRDLQESEMANANQQLRNILEQIKEKSSELESQRAEVDRLKQSVEGEKLKCSRELLLTQQKQEADLRELEAQAQVKKAELQLQIQGQLKELEQKDQEISQRLAQEERVFEKKLQEAKVHHEKKLKDLDSETEVKKAELDRFLDFKKIELNEKIDGLNQKYKDEQLEFEKRLVELKIKQLQELKDVQAEADLRKSEFENVIAQKKRELDERLSGLAQQNEEELRLLALNLDNKKSDIARALSAKQKELQDKIELLNHSYEEEERDLGRRIAELKKKNADELQVLQSEADQKRAENVRLLNSKQKELEDKIDLFNHSIQQEKSDFEQKTMALKEQQNKLLTQMELDARDRQAHLEKQLIEHRRDLEERVIQNAASLEEQKSSFNQQVLQLRQSQESELSGIQADFDARKKQLHSNVVLQEKELNLKIEVLGKAIRGEQETFDSKKRELDGIILTLNNEIASLQRSDAEIKSSIANAKQELVHQRGDLDRTQMSLVKSNAELKENLGRLSKLKIEIDSLEESKVQKQKDYDSQVLIFKSDLEKERLRLVKQEEEYIGKLKLENANRISKLKSDAATELVKTKEYLTKEIISYVNREMGGVGGSALWGKVSEKAYEGIQTLIQKQAYSIVGSQQEIDSTAQEFKKKQLRERNNNMGIGAAIGAVALVVVNFVYTTVLKNQTPIKDQLARTAQERELDLKKRKFNPPQTSDLKSTYVDAVIYTRDFEKIYLDTNYQAKWTKALTSYLFNSWRIEEDKTFQIISSINALVKLLAERRESIHPDFVKEAIAKMTDLETESLAKTKDILGTEVKFEAFKKFEKKFYIDEQLLRAPAHEGPARFDAPPPGE